MDKPYLFKYKNLSYTVVVENKLNYLYLLNFKIFYSLEIQFLMHNSFINKHSIKRIYLKLKYKKDSNNTKQK